MGRGGGLLVNAPAYCSEDPSSYYAGYYFSFLYERIMALLGLFFPLSFISPGASHLMVEDYSCTVRERERERKCIHHFARTWT